VAVIPLLRNSILLVDLPAGLFFSRISPTAAACPVLHVRQRALISRRDLPTRVPRPTLERFPINLPSLGRHHVQFLSAIEPSCLVARITPSYEPALLMTPFVS